MDMKKIGAFLKALRKEKGLTQEQAGEIFMVTGRTVSRWETGVNMPDLGLLVQIAEFYDVDLNEIFSGERRNEDMDKKLKDTLLKAADYSELEKENKFSVSGKGLEDFTGLADQGKINEAENMLLESIDYKNREELAAAILFYEYVSEKGEEFLRKHGYSLEEAAEGMKQIGEHAEYGELIKDLEL